jgi:5-methylcytosine-specific restriction endonuclease McrA
MKYKSTNCKSKGKKINLTIGKKIPASLHEGDGVYTTKTKCGIQEYSQFLHNAQNRFKCAN